ncbi:MAG TPA: zinc-ribbon domain-containing protein [Pseudolysinimonas sp.]
MTCRYCGSELPDDALYCGECGRAVFVDSLVGAGSVADSSGSRETPLARFAPGGSASASAPEDLLCPQCASIVEDTDVFCGECGFVLKATLPAGPRDTAVVEPIDPAEPVATASPAAELLTSASLDSESDSQPRKDPKVDDENETEAVAPLGSRARIIPDPFPWGAEIGDGDDVEATRIVSQNGTGERFVLQFSTGESVTVSGAGLIGRNPAAQPGEYVDQLVSIFDVGKSVSKTHLEFGQEGGRFWVSDRYSTNGSIVRQPESDARRCEPGRRYFVVRGTRIDIGEQFFVVS